MYLSGRISSAPCDILYEIPEPDERGMGEILITTLTHEAMPLIRYRTGDIGRMTDQPCGCGAQVRRLEKIWGRDSSIIKIGDASFFLSELAEVLYADDAVENHSLRDGMRCSEMAYDD